MTAGREEQAFRRSPDEPIGADPRRLREAPARELLVRFAFGAATSVVAGVVSLLFGPHVGGVLLAFPAILAASLTLIADDEGARDAREDARGAVIGAVALGAFAATGVVLFGSMPAGLVVVLASLVWLVVAVGLYLLLWTTRR